MKAEIKLVDPESPAERIDVRLNHNGTLWITPEGHGDFSSMDGHGSPICIEYYEGEVRVLVWDDINAQDPKIISLAGARESLRVDE